MLKKWKWILGAVGLIGAAATTTVVMTKKVDEKINTSDDFLNEAKKYVLENLDGEIKSSYIYKDEEDQLHGCIKLEKDAHIFNHKFDVIDNNVVFA